MNKPTFNSILEMLEEIAHTTTRLVRRGVRVVAGMSWPALIATCLVLALAITIVPLALFLFIVFMAIKLLVALTIVGTRRDKVLSKPGPAE